ncbi:M15 family metallopeptidase [Paenibacillus phocaensis]|uniref:M15 family metallopeptidase n=1 Tax=Paenibacillus phocaensis TaxID=1776378 RepID=UPI000839D73C|nr:M15 family metallopeptidase [Paenibacillus phocaensis]
MLTLEYVKSKSESKLRGLHPIVRLATEKLIERSFARGVPILITQGLRTIAEQDALYAQGRTKPGQIVTNARGGYSFHNFGVAIDFCLLKPDGKSVSWEVGRDWMIVVEIAKALGFAWGGDWTSFKDYPHFEMCFGLTTAQYRAGQQPTETAMAKALAKINKEDESMTAAEKAAFDKLEKRVNELEKAVEKIPAPKWFVQEFGSADLGGLISEPEFTAEGWRTLAIGLRATKK